MPRTYQIDGERTYHGIGRLFTPTAVQPTDTMIIAWFDGEPDLWLCDDPHAEAEILRFYADDFGDNRVSLQRFVPA